MIGSDVATVANSSNKYINCISNHGDQAYFNCDDNANINTINLHRNELYYYTNDKRKNLKEKSLNRKTLITHDYYFKDDNKGFSVSGNVNNYFSTDCTKETNKLLEDLLQNLSIAKEGNALLKIPGIEELTQNEIEILFSEAWFNDKIINTVFTILTNYKLDKKMEHKRNFYAVHTQFINSLYPRTIIGQKAINYNHFREEVAQNICWRIIDNIEEYDAILFPLHLNNNHWILIYVEFKNKSNRLVVLDSLFEDGKENDVLNMNAKAIMIFLNYLYQMIDENCDFRSETYGLSDYELAIHKLLPKQNNSHDCGLFMCFYAYSLTFCKNESEFMNYNSTLISTYGRKKLFLLISEQNSFEK